MSKIIDMYKSAVVHRYDDEGYKKYFTVDDFEGLNKREISFKSAHGDVLKGGIYSYQNNQESLIIFCHGLGAGHAQYMREINEFAKRGFEVVAYDNTGCDRSEGEDIRGFAESVSDLVSCIDYLASEGISNGRKLYVVGHSWGGYTAGNIYNYRKVDKVIVISGFVSVKTILKQALSGIASLFVGRLLKYERENNPEYADSSSLTALNKNGAKALVIHSLDDNYVSAKKNALYLQKNVTNPNVKFIITDKKRHNPNYTQEGVEYMTEVFSGLEAKVKSGELKTVEEKREYLRETDWIKMTNQDEEIFSKMVEFLNS